MITYRFACSAGALVCIILFAILLVAPAAYLSGYGIQPDPAGVFFGHRAAPLFLGLATLCWLLRDQIDRQVQWAVTFAMVLTLAGIAATGIWDFSTGQASGTILLAALGECVLAGAFLLGMRRPA